MALTQEQQKALHAAETHDKIGELLHLHCTTCEQFDERTVEGVLKRAAVNEHGDAMTPELEEALRLSRTQDATRASIRFHVAGTLDEAEVIKIIQASDASPHGKEITPELERVFHS